MASNSDFLYVTFVDVDRELLKVWGQRSRVGATYIERQLLQLVPKFNVTRGPNPSSIRKGMFCFAKFTDDNYYRARVISNVLADSVEVLFVDYGNKDIVKISNIRLHDGDECDVLAKMAEQAEQFYLARVTAPNFGWTSEIISEIRGEICYEELACQMVSEVGDQKILEIQFHNEDYSNILIKKQIARPIALAAQRQIILSYCSFITNEQKQNDKFGNIPPENFTGLQSPVRSMGNRMALSGQTNWESEPKQQVNFKPNTQVNFPHIIPRPNISKSHSNPVTPNTSKSNFPNSHISPVNHPTSYENISQPVSQSYSPMLNSQYNPLYQMKRNSPPSVNPINNVMIEVLAKQLKQYFAEDNKKSATEQTPHNYVNSVLEVGSTYNVLISCIDDGPWSFSIRLLSSESELEKLVSELGSSELVPIKPPIILGHPCVGLSQYGNYCRGVIVSISHSAVKVYFVDFGNTEDLSVSSIFELPPKFFKTRVLSQKFSLSGLQKVTYSDDIKRFFSEAVQDKLLMLRVISLEGDTLPTCELFLKNMNIKRILNEKMKELRNVTQEGSPKVGESEDVIVTWVVSPQKFYVQLSKKNDELLALKKELSEVPMKGQSITFQQLAVGFKCLSQFKTDGNWYRAVIVSMKSEDNISVFYIDYGNTETVDISLLRKIDGNGLINQMSAQAIQCSLKGFENQPFNQELANKLEALIFEKDLKMTVVSSDKEHICVELLDNGKDITSLMFTTSETMDKVNMNFSQNSGNDWEGSPKLTTNRSSPNKSERESKHFDNAGHVDKREKKNLGDDRRGKSNSQFNNLKSNKPKFRSTQAHSKKRFEGSDSWREDSNEWKEGNNNWQGDGRKGREEEFNRRPKFGENGTFKNDVENTRNGRQPSEGQKFTEFRTSRGVRSDGGRNERRGDSFDDSKKLGRGEGRRGNREENRRFGAERKRFENGKGSNTDGRRFIGSRGSSTEGKRFERKSRDRNEFSSRDWTPEESRRKPVKKEEIAPPGSKFVEKDIQIGSCEKGLVTYYFNPHEFFVQLLSQEEEFKKMEHEIQTYYSDKYSLRDPVEAGDIVIAQFSLDQVLYRGEVIKPSPVTVRYVDYGNQEPVGPKKTWVVAKQFVDLPRQVVKCRLSNILPLGSDWPPPGSEIDKFFESEEYQCTFLNFEDGFYEITMQAVENGKDVASEIIAAGLAKRMPPKFDVPEIDYSLLVNQILKLYISHVQCSNKFYVILNPKVAEEIQEEIKNHACRNENLIALDKSSLKPNTLCLTTNDGISWYRGTIVDVTAEVSVWLSDRGDIIDVAADKVMSLPEHLKDIEPQAVECYLHETQSISLNEKEFKDEMENKNYLVSIVSIDDKRLSVVLYEEDGQISRFQNTTDYPHIVEPIGHLPIFSQKLPVVISHLDSPKEIYIQRSDDWDTLGTLSDQLCKFYSEKGEDFDTKKNDKALVAAKSVVYETWYRARVLSSTENEVEVFYIDYGNKESLPLENVKILDKSFLNSNVFAKKVSLDVDYSKDAVQEINDKLMEFAEENKFLACFINTGDEFLSEFILNENRITSLLKPTGLITLRNVDRFSKIVPVEETNVATLVTEQSKLTSEPVCDNIAVGSLRAFMSHIDSPKRFWVHEESKINELHRFQDKLQECCKSLPEKQNAKLNDVVAAMFSDMWYRAKVVNVDGKHLTVQFIDYGNNVDIDLNSDLIKELTPELINFPIFATPYSLKGTWRENATAKFEEIILQLEDPVNVVILEEGNPAVVDLFQNGENIAEKLIQEGVSSAEDHTDLPVVYITHCNSPKDFYIQRETCTDSLSVLTNHLSDAENFDDVSSVEENEIYAAKFPDDGAWYRAKAVKKLGSEVQVHFIDFGNVSNVTEIKRIPRELIEIPVLAENCSLIYGNICDSWSEAACEKFAEYADGRPLKLKVAVNCAGKSIVRLISENGDVTEELEKLCEADGRFEVIVTHVLSPTDFYIQPANDDNVKLISEKLENGDYYDDLKDIKSGMLCLARFVDDNMWYRAKILQNFDEEYEVFFIDFGNISLCTEVKKLPPEIENIPPQAIRCSLDVREKNIPESVKEEFINLVAGGECSCRARIITPGEVNIISLKLDGRIVEETLTLDGISEESLSTHGLGLSSSLEDETDDDKNSKINFSVESYMTSNFEQGARTSSAVGNETDEEKRVKFAFTDVSSEGFKSDDEKGNAEGLVLSGIVNATDNELIEEIEESNEEDRNEIEEERESTAEMAAENPEENESRNLAEQLETEIDNKPVSEKTERTLNESENAEGSRNDKDDLDVQNNNEIVKTQVKQKRNTEEKIVPGSISRGESENFGEVEDSKNSVSESLSNEVSLNSIGEETSNVPDKKTKQNTPGLSRSKSKIDQNDRIVPGFICASVPVDISDRVSPSENVSSSINDSM